MEIPQYFVTEFWLIAKIAVLVFLGIYVIFSVVVVKQSKIMVETLKVELEDFIVIVSYLHMVFAMCVFVASIVLL